MTTNCVILARISSEKQDKEYSLPAQVSRLSDYAARRQMTVLREFVLIESSTTGDRKKFLECLNYCVANHAALLIDTIDRAQRSFMEIPLLEKYRRSGQLEIHFCRENIVINAESSGTEIIMWHQGVLMAESYSLHFKENVKRSISVKVARGEYPGRGPLGYKNIRTPDNRSDIILDENADLVRQLFVKYASGDVSLSGLVSYAYDIGLRTDTGGKLAKSHIHKIMSNPFYYGVARWGKYTFPHKYTPLIEKHLWDTCNALLTGKSQCHTRWGSKDYLYRGLIRDFYSRRIVTTECKKNRYNYLMTWDESGRHVSVNEDVVTAQIYKVLKMIQVPRDVIADVREYLKSAKEIEYEYATRVVSELQNDLNVAIKRQSALVNMYLDGKIADDLYSTKDAELKGQIAEIQSKLDANVSADSGVNDTIVQLFTAASCAADLFIESSEVAPKRDIIKSIFRTLELKGKTLCYDLNFPFNLFITKGERTIWRALADDFRTLYANDVRNLVANWNWVVPLAA